MLMQPNAAPTAALVGPDGKALTLAHLALSVEQARVLRGYERDILDALRLRRELFCAHCLGHEPMETEVNADFIALGCGCTLRSFRGPTLLAATTPTRDLREIVPLVDQDGQAATRHQQTLTPAQADLFLEYRRLILLPLNLREALYCQTCFEHPAIEHSGCRCSVRPSGVWLECRHAVRTGQATMPM